jgi:hypothetical protein
MKKTLCGTLIDRATLRAIPICILLAAVAILVGGPSGKVIGQSSGVSMLVAPVGKPGSDPGPAHKTPVLRFQFVGTGPLTPLSDIPPTPASAVDDPIFTAFNSKGELFVANRHGNVGGGVGSIARFTFDSAGNFFDNGTITGNSLEAVHGVAVSPTGELFAANLFNGRISRFLFDGAGNAIANGTIVSPGVNMGLAFSSSGELFVTHSSSLVDRYLFDSTGVPIPNGSFVVGGTSRLHGLSFNAQGELLLGDIDTSQVFRFTFDNAGNPVSNGSIFVSGGPIGVAFSSDGELFVSLHFSGGIARFLFDGSGNAIPNGFTPTDNLGGLAVFPSSCAQPPTITNASATPSALWPPNHKMVDVTINYDVTDDCDQPSDITCALDVSSNEPVDGTGDEDSSPDWIVIDSHHLKLRAERSGRGSGRVYAVTITCTDRQGNSSSKAVTVSVPKSQK